jgi:hypothetical protein
MERAIKIIKHGSKVVTKINKIEAIVTGTVIRFTAIQYELSYFDDKEYRCIWMNENEFDLVDKQHTKIGFNK